MSHDTALRPKIAAKGAAPFLLSRLCLAHTLGARVTIQE